MKYKVLSLLLAFAMLLSLTACSGNTPDASTSNGNGNSNAAMTLVGVSLSGTSETNPYGSALETQLKDVGYSVEIAYAEEGDQIKQISDMVNDGASLLIVEPEDDEAVKSALESISVDVSDVPVITIDSSIDSEIIRTHVGKDYAQLGKVQAQFAVDTLKLDARDEEDAPLTIEFLADKSGCGEKALKGAMSVLKSTLR